MKGKKKDVFFRRVNRIRGASRNPQIRRKLIKALAIPVMCWHGAWAQPNLNDLKSARAAVCGVMGTVQV